mgnify:CR=1 FL=1
MGAVDWLTVAPQFEQWGCGNCQAVVEAACRWKHICEHGMSADAVCLSSRLAEWLSLTCNGGRQLADGRVAV